MHLSNSFSEKEVKRSKPGSEVGEGDLVYASRMCSDVWDIFPCHFMSDSALIQSFRCSIIGERCREEQHSNYK